MSIWPQLKGSGADGGGGGRGVPKVNPLCANTFTSAVDRMAFFMNIYHTKIQVNMSLSTDLSLIIFHFQLIDRETHWKNRHLRLHMNVHTILGIDAEYVFLNVSGSTLA